ncbi:MAG: helix-turn-helix domain-containing protein [Candidatus Micrarchaeota archaeon]
MTLARDLESIGLSPSEIEVYQTLLTLGPTTTGPVIRKSGLQNSAVYRALDRLAAKGLVGSAQINGARRYTPEPPKRILAYLDEKREKLSKELEQLERIATQSTAPQLAAVFEGARGVKNAWCEDSLSTKPGDTIFVCGAPPRSLGLELYFRNFHKRRAAKGIRYKILYQQSAAGIACERAKSPLLETRIMPREFDSPVWFGVYASKAVVGVWSKQPLTIVINDPHVARGLLQYFNCMWKLSKPVR